VTTKFSNVFNEETKQITGSSATPEHIRAACDASLARLGTDYIDVYQFHAGDHEIEEIDEVLETLESLVQAGKIRSYGWSTDDPERARAFAKGANCTAVQFQLNVLRDNAEMIATCEQLDLAGLNRGPLAMGLLSGKYTKESTLPENDVRGPNAPGWMRYFKDGHPSDEFLASLESIREILTSNGRTLVQGALAWLLARSGRTFPIPGFRNVKQVTENAGALAKGPLTAQQVGEIAELLQQ
jgi:aryl-alcohol dehydrogenase-like predicted oxidoreductase